MRPKLTDIVNRYEARGNGSNMNTSDVENEIDERHESWGRFNS